MTSPVLRPGALDPAFSARWVPGPGTEAAQFAVPAVRRACSAAWVPGSGTVLAEFVVPAVPPACSAAWLVEVTV